MRILLVLCLATGAAAEIVGHDVPRGESAQTVQSAIALRRIETDLTYVERRDEEIPMRRVETSEREEPQPARSGGMESFSIGPTLIILLVVAGLAVVAWTLIRRGGAAASPTRQDTGSAAVRRDVEPAPPTTEIDRIASMADRREAVILLLRHALRLSANRTGRRLRPSDTAREALGRMPQDWTGRSALARIVAAEERVHYAGRDLDDRGWDEAVAAAKSLDAMERR